MMGSFILHFLVSSLAASAGVLLILVAKKGLKKHISARWQYNLDLLFLVLLVVPFIPSGLLTSFGTGNWLNVFRFGDAAANTVAVSGEGVGFASGMGWLQDFSLSVDRSAPEYLPVILVGIWIVGMAVFTALTLLCNRNLHLIKESVKPVEDAEILSVFVRCKAELGIKRNILLGTSVLAKTPMTVGFFKTRVILPAEKISLIDARYALLHELTHCKALDIPINSIMCLLHGLHWFNPLVYLAFRETRADREVACDTSVLKRLPEDLRINYGETLLIFAGTLSRSSALSFAADMGGTKPQIIRRVKHIAAYSSESWLLKIKSACVFAIAGLLIISQIPAVSALASYDDDKYRFEAGNVIYEDLSAFFDGFDGSFVLYDLETDSYTIHNNEMSVTRVSPASTFKIYSALIALETGVIDAHHSEITWDGTAYPFEAWNVDQDLTSAMQNSVNWYFQNIDAQVGINELKSYFTQLSYGNHNLSGGISDYWLESSLRISPIEQVELLKDFYLNNTIFKSEHINAVKSILRISEKDGAVLSGRTGTGAVNGKAIQLVVDPLAAEIVKRLFREFASGESGRNIASKLNAEGVDTPAVYYFKQTGKRSTRSDSCNQWGSATVIQLLRNQVYIGDMVQCKRKVSSFKTKKRLVTNQDDWVIVEDTHEALIDDFTWERVQQRLEATRKAPSNHGFKTNSTDEVNLFSGIIRCADCGAAMAFNRKVRTDGGERLFYRCSRYANNGKSACTMHKIDVEVLETVILHDIQQHANAAIQDEGPLLNKLLAFSGEACKSESAAREKSLRDATSRISFIETATKQLFEEKVIGNVPDSLFKKMLADYEREIAELNDKAIELRRHIQDNRNSRADVQRWLSLMKACATIDRLDRATAYQLIDSVAVHEQSDECGIRTQTVQVKYNFVGCIS